MSMFKQLDIIMNTNNLKEYLVLDLDTNPLLVTIGCACTCVCEFPDMPAAFRSLESDLTLMRSPPSFMCPVMRASRKRTSVLLKLTKNRNCPDSPDNSPSLSLTSSIRLSGCRFSVRLLHEIKKDSSPRKLSRRRSSLSRPKKMSIW